MAADGAAGSADRERLRVVRSHGEPGAKRPEAECTEGGRTEGGRTEGGRTEGGRTEGGRTEGGHPEAEVPAVRQPSGESVPLHPSDCGGFDRDSALAVLRNGEITVVGRVLDASNATLYCSAALGDATLTCAYKPVRGERPLWDFPDGTLAAREVAAFEVSEAMGGSAGGVVPPTVLRDGPVGPGMVQVWIDVDETVDLVTLVRSDDPRLRRVALFDAVVNNSDRKGGHLLPAPSGRVYGIDHGVTFHAENKLRTVLWTWRGKKLTADEVATLGLVRDSLDADLGERLASMITVTEFGALRRRVEVLLHRGRFPMPSDDWPPIPWPPF